METEKTQNPWKNQTALAKIGQSLCWESPAGHEFSPVRKKDPSAA